MPAHAKVLWGGCPSCGALMFEDETYCKLCGHDRGEACDGCEGNGVRDHTHPCEGLDVPEGWRVVERCDLCDQKASDLEAAQLVAKVAAWKRCRLGHLHAIATNDPGAHPL